jgi:DNA-binding transcriptional MerR regulator
MSERPYLSIGEVLELLKSDFPDLSISRIRALESAGQLELERTASGYRKFYDGDISYLRSLLSGGPATPPARRAGESASRSAAVAGRANQGSVAGNHDDGHDDVDDPPELGPNGELPGEPERRHPAAFQSLRRELASKPATVTPALHPAESGPEPAATARPDYPAPQLSIVSRSGSTATADSSRGSDAAGASALTTATTPVGVEQGERGSVSNAGVGGPASASQANGPTTESGSRNPLATDPSGVNLSLDELVAATGLSIEAIREIESLGLLKGQMVFSAVYYDEDALLTCKLVAAFRTHGVEPRHLRMYKLAADREASFFEQVVTPQLRRRNPDARQSAIDTLGELVKLGEQLRVVALRQVLKSSINK